ncbi:hypothetical protein BDQ12DRAFT_197851 [Crucibulum laeve]|uniref:Cytochrome c oxidase assembly factor 3 n=1 Tax=Crucibulum laeve TaxID=68775 RepID=A0A5C3MGS5_9AGAR|nr:hypothetical protein BDQ12DRAFT_197851 [Crucibulum laeve]
MSRYIDGRDAAKTYRPVAGSMSPGLKRAREPYRYRNALTGLVLGAFAAGVWAYSISAVKQDVFDDVDEEARALGATGTGTGLGVGVIANAVEEEKRIIEGAVAALEGKPLPSDPPLFQVVGGPSKGLLQKLDKKYPNLKILDPERKTLVWGAPPVDNIGKMGRS